MIFAQNEIFLSVLIDTFLLLDAAAAANLNRARLVQLSGAKLGLNRKICQEQPKPLLKMNLV